MLCNNRLGSQLGKNMAIAGLQIIAQGEECARIKLNNFHLLSLVLSEKDRENLQLIHVAINNGRRPVEFIFRF